MYFIRWIEETLNTFKEDKLHSEEMWLPSIEASSMAVEDVERKLGTSMLTGLTWTEAERRKSMFGANEFVVKKEDPIWRKYLEQFQNPLILLLLASAFVSICMKQFDDAVSITVAILIVVTVAFVQEYRSEKSLEALTKLIPPSCHCIREGQVHSFYARDLVPGDIVLLSLGEQVPADLRLFETIELSIDESSFTGETEPVIKQTKRRKTDENKSTWETMAYMGSLVRCGSGKGIVVSTGDRSDFGQMFRLMQAVESPKTPLQESMDTVSRLSKVLYHSNYLFYAHLFGSLANICPTSLSVSLVSSCLLAGSKVNLCWTCLTLESAWPLPPFLRVCQSL